MSAAVWWGTNPPGGRGPWYGGRLHLVWPGQNLSTCGLPVRTINERRPHATGRRLCPECCLLGVDLLFPEWPDAPDPDRENRH